MGPIRSVFLALDPFGRPAAPAEAPTRVDVWQPLVDVFQRVAPSTQPRHVFAIGAGANRMDQEGGNDANPVISAGLVGEPMAGTTPMGGGRFLSSLGAVQGADPGNDAFCLYKVSQTTMRNRSSHLGWVLASLNVLAFSTLLGARSPE